MSDATRNSSRRPYIFFFGLCAAAVIALTAFYLNVEKNIKQRIYQELSAVADLKLQQIVDWRRSQASFAANLAGDPFLIENLERWNTRRGDMVLRDNLLLWMENAADFDGFSTIMLIDTAAVPLLSLRDTLSLRDSLLLSAINSARASGKPVYTDLHQTGKTGITIDIVVPIADRSGRVSVLFVFEKNPRQFLFPLIQSWPIPSRTGETLLFHVKGDSVEFLNELRHRKNGALTFRLPLATPGLLAAEAIRSGNGVHDRLDYRGVPVLGAVRAVPDSPWYMVAKVDKTEILSPVRRLLAVFIAFLLLLAAGAFAVVALIYRHRKASHYRSLFLAEQEKNLSEARFRSLFECMTEGMALHEIVHDDKGKPVDYRIIDLNPAFTRHTGISQEKARGRLATELYNVAQPPYFDDYLRVTTTHLPFSFETFFPPMNRHFSVAAFSTGIDLFATVFEDITARKKYEERLAAEKERLLVTLRSIGDGVITTDTDGKITLMNKVAEKLTGWDQAESLGRPLAEVFHIINENTRQRCENPVEKVLKTGGIIGLANHTALLAKDGRELVIADSGAPIRDAQSNIIGVVLVFRDITEQQKTEEALRNAQKLESIGVLAGGIAHDFNNLLGGIFGYLSLAMDENTDRKTAGYLAKIMDTMDRARALTRQLLTFAKGGAPARRRDNLFPFAAEAARFALSGGSVSCGFDVQEGLWPCDFDRDQIGQVIDNIIINAQQAMPRGGSVAITAKNVTLAEAQVGPLKKGPYVRISIRDSGIGIPSDILPRIFDPFFTTKQKGSGLGLATAFSIMNRHDGYIEAESEQGKGSTFHLYLPAVPGEYDAPSSPPSPPSPAHRGAGRIFVMDDEEVLRETIGNMLKSLGYTVEMFTEGNELLLHLRTAMADRAGPVAIILDLTVPGGMGGKETAQEIRKRDTTVPIFISSGYAEDPILANPGEFGCSGSITKPYSKAELEALLEKHLGKR